MIFAVMATALCVLAGLVCAWFLFRRPRRKPRSSEWMENMWSADRSKTPHMLLRGTSGLRPMQTTQWIVVEDKQTFCEQMKLRRRLLDDPATVDRFYASQASESTRVLRAEQEVLDAVLTHLETYYPHSHRVVRDRAGNATSIEDLWNSVTFSVQKYAKCPLKLAAKLVQEDFILLDDAMTFVGGCALFSFMEIGLRGEKSNMNLGETVKFIHTNVPNFNSTNNGIGTKVNRYFHNLKPGDPGFFRTNWLLVPEVGLNPMRYNLATERATENYFPVTEHTSTRAQDLNLRVEFQSITRLRESGMTLFCLHVYSDPLATLSQAPKAAAVLHRAVKGLSDEQMKYRGTTEAQRKEVCQYLKQLAGSFM